jgi:hypothetical protein
MSLTLKTQTMGEAVILFQQLVFKALEGLSAVSYKNTPEFAKLNNTFLELYRRIQNQLLLPQYKEKLQQLEIFVNKNNF